MPQSRLGNCKGTPDGLAVGLYAVLPTKAPTDLTMPQFLLYFRTLTIGALGGLVGYLFHFPLGWLVGAMLSTIPCAMAGVRVPTHWGLRSMMIGTIGLMAGAAFTPDVVSRAGEWAFSLAGVAVYCVIITAIGLFICLKVGKLDRATAAFSAAPGGLSEILVLGPSYGADVRSLSLVHGMRLTVILVIVPFVIVWVGTGNGPTQMNRTLDLSLAMPLKDYAILGACLIVGVIGGKKIRLPGSHLTGPLILSAIVHYFGLTHSSPPQLIVVVAQIVIGTSVAQFFNNTTLRQVLGGLVVGGGLTVVNLGVAALFALAFQTWLGIPFAAGLIALVPGGLPEMSLISIALGLDAAFVSLHHLFRVVLVLVFLPLLVPLWISRPGSSIETKS
jgi:membrane AbrB-like protein